MDNTTVKIIPRGDDIKCFQEIIKLTPKDREDLLSYMCYLRNEFLEQLGLDKRPYDISLWSEDDINNFLDTGINPFIDIEKSINENQHNFNKTEMMLNDIKDKGFYGIINKID